MTRRLHEWLEDTHGTRLELVRHFLARFFDNDMVSVPGEWQKVAIGLLASLISIGLAALSIYWTRYRLLHGASFSIYRQGVRDDLISFIALSMAVTALLTILQWQSLFPSLRDCLALAGLPLRPREIFLAKFTALALVFTTFVLAMTAVPSILFAIVTNLRQHENPEMWISMAANFAALAGGCMFVFFTLLALQGVLLQIFPAQTFARVSLGVQAVLFILTVGTVPLIGSQPTSPMWWPPVWFVRLWEAIVLARWHQAWPGIYAITVPVVISIATYLLSYHRYRKMLLESQARPVEARWAGLGARLLDRFFRDPREQAAFSFIGTTLLRSRSHRLLLLAYAGIALGWTAKGLVESPPVNLRDEGLYGLTVVLAPIAMAILIVTGLRYLFALPVTHRANWVFQAVESEDRPAWCAGTEKFVVWAGIVPVFAAGLPASAAVLGPVRGFAAIMLGLGIALIFFERYFREWRKLPFTCSYLPGQQTVWMLIFRVFLASTILLPTAQLFLWASAHATSFVAASSALAVWWLRWRARRRREWAASSMLWDELPPPPFEALDLQRAKDDDAPLLAGGNRPSEPRDFGGTLVASRGFLPQAWSEEIDEERRSRALWETAWEDVRYGARLILRNPLLSAVVVLTLTIGIGINASIFTVLSGSALTPQVNRDPASFLRIYPLAQQDEHVRAVSYKEYTALRDRNHSLNQLAAFNPFIGLIGEDDSVGTPALMTSCNFFLVEGLDRALIGRLLDAGDCTTPGQTPVAVISELVWRTRFSADPKIVGRVMHLNNHPVPIVGVVANRTSLWARPTGVWIPYTSQPYFDTERNFFREDVLWLQLAGRLAPGYSRAKARAEFAVLARQLDGDSGRRTLIETTDGSWYENFELIASARQLFLMTFFLGAFHLVLVIACANVATLLLSRAAARRREIAVRLSLGAPRVRLVRMLVTEAILLAAVAGAASVWLLYRVPQPLWRFISPRSPEIPLPPDWHIFTYVAIVVILTGIASGLVPALESVKVDLADSLKSGGGKGQSGVKARGWLVTVQVAVSLVLLVEAAMLGKSEDRNLNADPGYLPRHVVVAPLRFPETITPAAARVRRERIEARVRRLPGVRSVSFSTDVPMIDHYTVEVRPPARPDAVQPVDIYSGQAGFMTTLGVPLVRGRDFDRLDRQSAVVSESLAKTFFGRRNPVGQSLQLPAGAVTIVGVVRDIAPLRVGGSENPSLWLNDDAHPEWTFISVRFATPEMARAHVVRAAIAEADPGLMVIARNLQQWIDLVTEEMWNMVTLIVLLGVVATVLATTGIYGAVSFAVNQRMRDLGIRLALGAQRTDIVWEVLLMGGRPVARGLMLGAWLSVAMAASLHENLRGSALRIDSTDPFVYIAAILALATAAVLAMCAPAHRGSKSDPLESLRCE